MTSSQAATLGLPVRAFVFCLLVLAAAACGAYHFPGGPAGTGTVSGQVIVVPCGPVEPAQPGFAPCKMRPAAGLELDFTSDGTVTSAQTNADGRYTIRLTAGTYKVSVKNYPRVISGPPAVTVKAGAMVVADYVLDSGIRTVQ